MVSEKEFDEILEKMGVVEQCRRLWWKSLASYQPKFNIDKDSLKNLVIAVTKNGCKAPCGL